MQYKRPRGPERVSDASLEDGCVYPFPAVRLRGLPYGASKPEIADFLDVAPVDIVIQTRAGKPSGSAYVLCAGIDDWRVALEKDKKHMGARYIDIFECQRAEFHRAVADEVSGGGVSDRFDGPRYGARGPGAGPAPFRDRDDARFDRRTSRTAQASPSLDSLPNPRGVEAVVKLRGLPYSSTPNDVMTWINDAYARREISLSKPVAAEDVVLATKNGQSVGIAFVECSRAQDADRITALHGKYLSHRYVEVHPSSREEQTRFTGIV